MLKTGTGRQGTVKAVGKELTLMSQDAFNHVERLCSSGGDLNEKQIENRITVIGGEGVN